MPLAERVARAFCVFEHRETVRRSVRDLISAIARTRKGTKFPGKPKKEPAADATAPAAQSATH